MPADVSDSSLLAGDITRIVIGAFFDTYNELGPGFPEFVARRALAMALRDEGLDVLEETSLPVWFRRQRIATFRADLVVAGTIIVEVKTTPDIEPFHAAQVLHYLKATDLEVGLLVNFGRRPQFKRVIYQNGQKLRPSEAPREGDAES